MTLMTNFKVGNIPHSEYPRPQFVRDSFLCLNGKWDFAVAKKDCKSVEFNRKILVPFSPECLNSGINEQLLKDSNDIPILKIIFPIPNGRTVIVSKYGESE